MKASGIKIFYFVVMVCVLSFYSGVFIGKNRGFFKDVLSNLIEQQISGLPDFPNVRGDPQLVQFVNEQQLRIPRPTYSSKNSLSLWQETLRRELQQRFSFSEATNRQKVAFHEVSIDSEEQGIVRKKIIFESFDGTHIPAFLLAPLLTQRAPAILVLPGHVLEGESGVAQTSGLVESYQHSVALKLAQAGFVTLTIELRGFGILGNAFNTEHRFVAYNAILGGSFYKAVVSRDIQYAINFLQALDQVDPHRMGITGVSYGGEMAVTYAALDKRIKAIVFQGFGGLLGPIEGKLRGKEQPHYCHIIPGSPSFLFQEDIFFLVAPRSLLGVRGTQDVEGDPHVFKKEVKNFYEKIEASSSFDFVIVPGGHEYFIDPAVTFFRHNL